MTCPGARGSVGVGHHVHRGTCPSGSIVLHRALRRGLAYPCQVGPDRPADVPRERRRSGFEGTPASRLRSAAGRVERGVDVSVFGGMVDVSTVTDEVAVWQPYGLNVNLFPLTAGLTMI